MLEDWEIQQRKHFIKVMPIDYKKSIIENSARK
jgi:glutamate synthase domain-containing protein 3